MFLPCTCLFEAGVGHKNAPKRLGTTNLPRNRPKRQKKAASARDLAGRRTCTYTLRICQFLTYRCRAHNTLPVLYTHANDTSLDGWLPALGAVADPKLDPSHPCLDHHLAESLLLRAFKQPDPCTRTSILASYHRVRVGLPKKSATWGLA